MVTLEEIKKTLEYKLVESEYNKAVDYARKCDGEKAFIYYGSAARLSEFQQKRLFEKYPSDEDKYAILGAFIDLVRRKRGEILEELKHCGCTFG